MTSRHPISRISGLCCIVRFITYPLQASGAPPQTTTGRASKKTRIKRESRFQRIDHRTRRISCGGLNQREPPALPDSPSPRVSTDTLFLPTSRAPKEQRQSRRSHSGGKLGGKRGIGGIALWCVWRIPNDVPLHW